jgi:hypothetical protein
MLECRFVLVLLFPHRHLYLGLNFFFFASFRGPGSIAIWTGPSHKYGKCNRLALSDAIRWAPWAADSVPSSGIKVLTIPLCIAMREI